MSNNILNDAIDICKEVILPLSKLISLQKVYKEGYKALEHIETGEIGEPGQEKVIAREKEWSISPNKCFGEVKPMGKSPVKLVIKK